MGSFWDWEQLPSACRAWSLDGLASEGARGCSVSGVGAERQKPGTRPLSQYRRAGVL